jgi:putative membrane protein
MAPQPGLVLRLLVDGRKGTAFVSPGTGAVIVRSARRRCKGKAFFFTKRRHGRGRFLCTASKLLQHFLQDQNRRKSMKFNSTSILTSVALALTLTSCAHSANDATIKAAVSETAQMTSGGGNTLTDADSAGIGWTINDGEIKLARLAVQNASSPAVRDFAQMMITDHTNANAQLQTQGYGKIDNPATLTLNGVVNKTMTMLQSKSGAAFDQAYIASQVDMHQTALETMRSTLMPSASNKDLRAIFSTMDASVQMHLQRARELQTSTGMTR